MQAVTRTSVISGSAFALDTRKLGDDPATRADEIATLGLGLDLRGFDHVLTAANLVELDRLFPPSN